MPVFRWGHGWGAFPNLEQEVDRLLNDVNWAFQGLRVGRQYPPINLYEESDEFLLTAELPGTDAGDLEVTIASGILTISGVRNATDQAAETRYRRQERHYGPWKRAVSLPERVQEDELKADISNGVLVIRIPKAEAERPRQIPVADGDGPTPIDTIDVES